MLDRVTAIAMPKVPVISVNSTSPLALPRCTKHMAKDGQVFFHRGPFANPVKQQRCTTEPVGPLDGINKDVYGAKLHPMAVLAYPVDCDC